MIMKIKLKSLLVLLCLYAGFSTAQEAKQMFFGIETGMTFMSCKMKNMDYVRAEMPSYPMDYYSDNSVSSMMYNSFVGLKPEFFVKNDKFGIAAGLRYTRTNASIFKDQYAGTSNNFFYLLYRQDGINTEYLKVKEIVQASDCIGIPLEIRYFVYKPRLFRLYFKLGAEANFRLRTQTDVVFFNNAMESYEEEVTEIVGQPALFSASLYTSVGLRIGRNSKPTASIELCAPVIALNQESSAMVSPIAGGGFQVNIQLPYKSKVQ
jgi:hypothetical protein